MKHTKVNKGNSIMNNSKVQKTIEDKYKAVNTIIGDFDKAMARLERAMKKANKAGDKEQSIEYSDSHHEVYTKKRKLMIGLINNTVVYDINPNTATIDRVLIDGEVIAYGLSVR